MKKVMVIALTALLCAGAFLDVRAEKKESFSLISKDPEAFVMLSVYGALFASIGFNPFITMFPSASIVLIDAALTTFVRRGFGSKKGLDPSNPTEWDYFRAGRTESQEKWNARHDQRLGSFYQQRSRQFPSKN